MDRRTVIPSLWDVEDTEATEVKVRDMHVAPASTRDVQEFARRYHYTGVGNNINWRWGLYHGVVLHGVVAYNLPTRSVCASVFGEEYLHNVWHMGRLVLSDDSPRNSESRLIGGSLRAIQREQPQVWAVLTYAATDVGHLGYVYQATNALYTGTAGDPFYYTRHKGGVKHRYLYVLGNKTQRRERMKLLRLPTLPYPKESTARVEPV